MNPVSRRDALRGGMLGTVAAALSGVMGTKALGDTPPTSLPAADSFVPQVADPTKAAPGLLRGYAGGGDPATGCGDLSASQIGEISFSNPLDDVMAKLNEVADKFAMALESRQPQGESYDPVLYCVPKETLLQIAVDNDGDIRCVRDSRGRMLTNVQSVSWKPLPTTMDPLLSSPKNDVVDATMSLIVIPQLYSHWNGRPANEATHNILKVGLIDGEFGVRDGHGERIPMARVSVAGKTVGATATYTLSVRARLVPFYVPPTGEALAQLRAEWVKAFGDPADPEVKKEIELLVDELTKNTAAKPADVFNRMLPMDGMMVAMGCPEGYGPNRNGDIFKRQEMQRAMASLQLGLMHPISKTTSLHSVGLDWRKEQQALAEEARYQAELQASVQEEMSQHPVKATS